MRGEHTVQIRDEWLVPTVEDRDALAWSPGRYRLCFEVASGGMATVYLALYHGSLGFERVVALKTIHPHLAKERQFTDMFLDEARIAAHIDHPFVCKVVDFGEARDSYYIAMEYLSGEPLSAVWEAIHDQPALAASPELPFVVARIAADLCEGLHAAHELTDRGRPMKIVHRDVSPANLFVCYDGTVRVVDFGIAKAESKLHHTETGTVKGKYGYLSPEQLELRDVDRRSDVFSLGVVVWELLTGRRLFKRDSPIETMQRVMSGDVPPPASIRGLIPPELDAIVTRALAKSRADRFSSAREMSLALEAFLGGRGRTVPRAEVSAWLDELMPGERARKRQLVEMTRHGDTAVPMVDQREEEATGTHAPAEPTEIRRRGGTEPAMQVRETEAIPLDERGVIGADRGRQSGAGEVTGRARTAGGGAARDGGPAREDGEADWESRRASMAQEATDVVVPVSRRKEAPGASPSKDADARGARGAGAATPPRTTPQGPPPRRTGRPMLFAAAAIAVGAGVAWYTSTLPASTGSAPGAATEGAGAGAGGETAGAGASGPSQGAGSGEALPSQGAASGEAGSGAGATGADTAAGAAATGGSAWPPLPSGDPDEVASGAPGLVQIHPRGEGAAEVFLDGARVGRTGEAIRLPPGRHRLELRPEGGGEPRPLDVQIRAGRTLHLNVSLTSEG